MQVISFENFSKEYHVGDPELDTLTLPRLIQFGNTCKQHKNS